MNAQITSMHIRKDRVSMKHRPGTYLKGILVALLIIMMSATTIPAAEIILAWDASCNEYPDLIGYNIYFKADSSVAEDPDGAELIYIALTDSGFDPDQPTYTVSGLSDNVRYYFTVTAMLEDKESAMSNEVSAEMSTSSLSSDSSSGTAGTDTVSSSGCFISAMQ